MSLIEIVFVCGPGCGSVVSEIESKQQVSSTPSGFNPPLEVYISRLDHKIIKVSGLKLQCEVFNSAQRCDFLLLLQSSSLVGLVNNMATKVNH